MKYEVVISQLLLPSQKAAVAEDPADDSPSWSILKDDFMTGAKMKDWDMESEGSDGEGGEGNMSIEVDSDT